MATSRGNRAGSALGQGLSQLGQLMMQAQQQEADDQRRNAEWERRFQMQADQREQELQDRRDYENEPVPLLSLPMLGDVQVPRNLASQLAQPLMYMMRDAAKGEGGAYNPETDPVVRRKLYLDQLGVGEDPKPRDPQLDLGTRLGNQQKIDDMWIENLPPGPQWDWLLATGGAAPAKALFSELVSGGMPAAEASTKVAAKLGDMPDNYYFKPSGDTYTVREDRSRWPDRTISDQKDVESLRQMLLSGYGGGEDTGGQADSYRLSDGSELVNEGGQWVVYGPDGKPYRALPEDLAEAGVR